MKKQSLFKCSKEAYVFPLPSGLQGQDDHCPFRSPASQHPSAADSCSLQFPPPSHPEAESYLLIQAVASAQLK